MTDASGRRPAVKVDGYVRRASDAAHSARTAWEVRQWIERRGWRLARLHVDVAPTRSALREAIGRVQSRETNGLVVTTLSQLAGTDQEAVVALERIHAAGGIFVSVRDHLDLSTPAGRRRHRRLLAGLERGSSGERDAAPGPRPAR